MLIEQVEQGVVTALVSICLAHRQRRRKEGKSDAKTDSELWARLEQLEEEEKDWLMEEERRGVASELELATSFPKEPESTTLSDTLSPASLPPAPLNIPVCHTMHTIPMEHTNSASCNSREEQHARFTNPGDIFKQFSKAKLTSEGKGKDGKEDGNGGTVTQQRKQEPRLPKPKTISWDAQLEHHETERRGRQGSDRPRRDVQQQPSIAIVSKLVLFVVFVT